MYGQMVRVQCVCVTVYIHTLEGHAAVLRIVSDIKPRAASHGFSNRGGGCAAARHAARSDLQIHSRIYIYIYIYYIHILHIMYTYITYYIHHILYIIYNVCIYIDIVLYTNMYM